ncbi:MAG: glycosyltransferase family 2 protein [Planctomycetota bacterium]
MSVAASHGVWAVVINWNGGEENLRCLQSLLAAGIDAAHVVFVDNGSITGTARQVRSHFPGLNWIQNRSNQGFAEAANQGARRALELGALWVLFVNNDLELDEHCLQTLMTEAATDPRIGVLAPRILETGGGGRIWACGGAWNRGLRLVRLLGHGQQDGPGWQWVQEPDFLTGAALLVCREAWSAVGGFDSDYFAYMEDVELSLRARAEGWRVCMVGAALAHHAPSSTTGGGYSARRKYMMTLNTVRLLRKLGTGSAWMRWLATEFLPYPLVLIAQTLRGNGRAGLAKGLGLWHGLTGRKVKAAHIEPGGSRLWPKPPAT